MMTSAMVAHSVGNNLQQNQEEGRMTEGDDTTSSDVTTTSITKTSSLTKDEDSTSETTDNCDLNDTPILTNGNKPSDEEMALLAKLEEANRLIEIDAKSLNSLSGSGHSRKSSDASETSITSGNSAGSLSVDRSEDTEEDLWGSWGRVVNEWDVWWKKKNPVVRDLVKRGVPHHFRGIVWQLLCGAHDSPVKKMYAEYIKATSACEKVIRRDIARTYPEHDFFKEKDGLGQESLFNVMKAYSLYDREVGYCQGSAFIVGLLLMQMPEEEAFAVLVKLMQDYRMRDMFKPTMAELGLCMYQLENLVQEQLPDINVHFQSQSFHTSMYASSWFLTLFTTSLPLPIASRIMDVFLSENMEIIFKIALALLTISKEDLLCLDMEGMLKYFQKDLQCKVVNDPDGLMQLAYNIKLNPKKMKKLEKDYTVMKTKEQEEMVELRRLRTENRLLKHRIDVLEAESSALADRLIQGQVIRAEEEEETFVLKRELAAVRQHDTDTLFELEQEREKVRYLSQQMEESQCSRQSSIEEMSAKSEMLIQKEEISKCLQQELVNVRLRDAESEAIIRDLRARIQELEEDKKKLRESTPDNSVAHLQDELIAVKLREAEASLSLKELRQKVGDLTAQWQKHLQDYHTENPPQESQLSTPKKLLPFWENSRAESVHKLEEELMTVRLREMEALTELKELRLKVMELETQVQVSTNQLRRQDEETKHLRDQLEHAESRERERQTQLQRQNYKYNDLESKMKEELIKARITNAENTQCVVELTQAISNLKLKTQEKVAEGELRNNIEDNDRVKELHDKVAGLRAQVVKWQSLCRRLSKSKYNSESPPSPTQSSPDEEYDDLTDDLRLQLDIPVKNGPS